VRRVPERGCNPRALQGCNLELELEPAGGCQDGKEKDAREPPADHARAKTDRKRDVRQRHRDEGASFTEQRCPVLSDAEGGAAVREVHERVTDAELRLLVAERGHAIEGAEEVGFDRGPWGPLPEHRRSVEGEVDAGVPDVAVEDSLVDAGLPRTSRYRNSASGKLGVLALRAGPEQSTAVEHRRADY